MSRQPVPGLYHPLREEFLPNIGSHPVLCQWKTIPSGPVTPDSYPKSLSGCLGAPLGVESCSVASPEPSQLQAEHPQVSPSLSLEQRGSSSPWSISSGLAPAASHPCDSEDTRAGGSSADGVPPERSRIPSSLVAHAVGSAHDTAVPPSRCPCPQGSYGLQPIFIAVGMDPVPNHAACSNSPLLIQTLHGSSYSCYVKRVCCLCGSHLPWKRGCFQGDPGTPDSSPFPKPLL